MGSAWLEVWSEWFLSAGVPKDPGKYTEVPDPKRLKFSWPNFIRKWHAFFLPFPRCGSSLPVSSRQQCTKVEAGNLSKIWNSTDQPQPQAVIPHHSRAGLIVRSWFRSFLEGFNGIRVRYVLQLVWKAQGPLGIFQVRLRPSMSHRNQDTLKATWSSEQQFLSGFLRWHFTKKDPNFIRGDRPEAFDEKISWGNLVHFPQSSSLTDVGFYLRIRVRIFTLNWPIFIRRELRRFSNLIQIKIKHFRVLQGS